MVYTFVCETQIEYKNAKESTVAYLTLSQQTKLKGETLSNRNYRSVAKITRSYLQITVQATVGVCSRYDPVTQVRCRSARWNWNRQDTWCVWRQRKWCDPTSYNEANSIHWKSERFGAVRGLLLVKPLVYFCWQLTVSCVWSCIRPTDIQHSHEIEMTRVVSATLLDQVCSIFLYTDTQEFEANRE